MKNKLTNNKKYLKKIYNEVNEDLFDMSNVRNFKNNEIKHYIGMFSWLLEILCFDFIQLSSVKHLETWDFNRESMRPKFRTPLSARKQV